MMVWFDKCRFYIWNIFIMSCIYFLRLKRTRSNTGPNRTTGRICASHPVPLWFGGCSMAVVSTCQQSGLETGTATGARWIFLFNLFLFTWHSLDTAVQPQWGHQFSLWYELFELPRGQFWIIFTVKYTDFHFRSFPGWMEDSETWPLV